MFVEIVGNNAVVFVEKYAVDQYQDDYRIFNNSANTIVTATSKESVVMANYNTGQYFYFTDSVGIFKFIKPQSLFVPTLDYKVYSGRKGLKFQYIHNADADSRIDPGMSNINDIYVLTKQYDKDYRQWLLG